jgi:hypothetical protein
LLTQQFQEPPLRFIIKEKLPTSRPTRHMIHPLLAMHQVPTPKTPSPQILHFKNLKKAEPNTSFFSFNTLRNLSDWKFTVVYAELMQGLKEGTPHAFEPPR